MDSTTKENLYRLGYIKNEQLQCKKNILHKTREQTKPKETSAANVKKKM